MGIVLYLHTSSGGGSAYQPYKMALTFEVHLAKAKLLELCQKIEHPLGTS